LQNLWKEELKMGNRLERLQRDGAINNDINASTTSLKGSIGPDNPADATSVKSQISCAAEKRIITADSSPAVTTVSLPSLRQSSLLPGDATVSSSRQKKLALPDHNQPGLPASYNNHSTRVTFSSTTTLKSTPSSTPAPSGTGRKSSSTPGILTDSSWMSNKLASSLKNIFKKVSLQVAGEAGFFKPTSKPRFARRLISKRQIHHFCS
jgi:hypothetical protein